jgi:hypothetical protein
MDWLILLLLVPMVLVPVVLLHGFAGCAGVFGLQHIDPPSAPKNLTAMPVPSPGALASVALTWENTDATAGAQIERAVDGGDFMALPDPADPSKTLVVMDHTFTDETAAPGTVFLYQVRANKQGLNSDNPSNMVTVATFKTAFLADNTTSNTDQANDGGLTLVQILDKMLLQASGQLVNLTLRGPSMGTLTLDNIFISNVAATGDPYDSDVAPIPVASGFPLNSETKAISPAGTFFLDQSKALLVAFDINPVANTGRFATLPQGGATAYAKQPPVPGGSLNEAGVMNRSPGYGSGVELFLVHKIEVM